MSGKKGKRRSGDPRKHNSGRVTPSKKPKTGSPLQQTRNIPPEIIRIDLNEVIKFIAKPLEEIPTPDEPYYVEGFEGFNPLFDEDDYFIKLREAFAREMNLTLGDFFPDPNLAKSAHLLFVERLQEQLQARIPEIARDTQSTLELYFRSRFDRHGEPGSFERWDKEVLNGFFADQRLIRLAEIGIPISYIDEIVDGPVSTEMGGSFSTVMHNLVVEGDQVDFVPSSITLFSVTVNEALREGYNFDEIVDGLARHALSFEIMNFASSSAVTDIRNDSIDIRFGLSIATLNSELEFTGPPIAKWGHCGFLSALHCRLRDDVGIGYYAEQSMIELLDRYDPLFFERLFAALVSDGDEGVKHEIVTDTMKHFVKDVFKDPQIIEPLLHIIESSKYGMEESTQLHHALFTALILDEHWGAVSRAITNATSIRQLDYTFFTTPSVVQSAFNDLAR